MLTKSSRSLQWKQKERLMDPKDMNLKELKELAREHWKKHRPSLFRALEKEGSLEQRLENAANFTLKGYEVEKKRLLERGYQENQAHEVAWELVREEWLLLPDQDQKDYGKAKENANPDLMQLLGSKNPPRRVKMPETSE
jgi:hypothetical protein